MRPISILTGLITHLDHLGVLSALLEIPLLVTEEKTAQLAKKFYPGLDVRLCDPSALTLEYLAREYDAIFETGKFWVAELAPSLELLYKKKMRFVFCPHGNSNKGHSLQDHVGQDISLVYGAHLHDLLKNTGAKDKIAMLVRTGNYRLPYYLRHKHFFDRIAEEEVFCRCKAAKPIALYAPTWDHKEHPSSFFSAVEILIQQLEETHSLLIKLHPFLLEDHPAHVYSLISRYEDHPSVLFLSDFPPIYPLLARCALYIGDYSSIGYDFLAFDKPLFFLKNSDCPLSRCGLTTRPEELRAAILSHRDEVYAKARKEVYAYAFGEEVAPEELRRDIFSLLRG